MTRIEQEPSDHHHSTYIIGHSQSMQAVFELVARVARSNTASVLITGESGTGKEVVARAIHDQSLRASGPFFALNCAAIASSLIESELFGYEQYAFTDAKKQRRGLLELADEGTLFLDEIGEMPLAMQAKLLRVLETYSFFRLGGSKEVKINVRLLAATNRNLEQAMQDGSFRSDLFFRLAVLHIALPPLRERPEDILLFAERFIADFNKSLGRNVQRLAPQMQQLFLAYHWPGNIREVKNVIERAMILSNGDDLLPIHLPPEITERGNAVSLTSADPWEQWLDARPLDAVSLEEVRQRVDQYFLRWALETAKRNPARATELLGLAKVDQLRYLMRKYRM